MAGPVKNAIILAAGKGERLKPITETRPKPMIPILGKPQLEWQISALVNAGIERIIIVIGYLGEIIQDYFGDTYKSARIEYAVQREQRGTGHALLQCDGKLDSDFLVLMGDDFYSPSDIERMARSETPSILVSQVEDPQNYGVVVGSHYLEDILEKPGKPPSNLVNSAMYKLDPSVFQLLKTLKPSPRGELELTDAIKELKPRLIKASFWRPVTYPWHYLDLARELMEKRMCGDPEILGQVSERTTISGDVWIWQGSEILEGTRIEGPAWIGKDCRIGPNAYIRPGTVVGDGCRIGMSEVKASIILGKTNVPHFNYVGDSLVGEGCNFGAGSKIANLRFDDANVKVEYKGKMVDSGRRKLGGIIGDGVKIGINAMIMPGTKIGSGSFIGPGKVVKGDIPARSRLL